MRARRRSDTPRRRAILRRRSLDRAAAMALAFGFIFAPSAAEALARVLFGR
jgi:hypothetical protein